MELPNRHQALVHIGLFLRIGLVEHPFIAASGGPGLVGIDPGNKDQLVAHLLADPGQTLHIFAYRVLPVRRARPDDHQEFIAFPGKYRCDLFISFLF